MVVYFMTHSLTFPIWTLVIMMTTAMVTGMMEY